MVLVALGFQTDFEGGFIVAGIVGGFDGVLVSVKFKLIFSRYLDAILLTDIVIRLNILLD